MEWTTADLLDLHPETSVLDHGLRPFGGGGRMAGPVLIVQAPADNTHVRAALETPGEGRVLVVDGEGVMSCALVGDNLASLALENGWAGIVINGCIRDSAIIASMPVAVWALGTSPRRSDKKDRGGVIPETTLLDVRIQQGDWLYADTDGVLAARTPIHDS